MKNLIKSLISGYLVVSVCVLTVAAAPEFWREHKEKAFVYRLSLSGVAPTLTQIQNNNLKAGDVIIDTSNDKSYTLYSVSDAGFVTIDADGLLTAVTYAGGISDAAVYDGTKGTDPWAGVMVAPKPSDVLEWNEEYVEGGWGASATNFGKYSLVADYGQWLVTIVDSGTLADASVLIEDDAPGGWLSLKTTANADDAVQKQVNGEAFELVTGKELWLETKFSLTDIDENVIFVGLANQDTTVLQKMGSAIGLPDNHIGFYVNDETNLYISVAEGAVTNQFDTGVDMAAFSDYTNYVKGQLYFDGSTSIYTWVSSPHDSTMVISTTIIDNAGTILIPNAEAMTPTAAILVRDAANDKLYLEYIDIVVEK